MNGDRAGNRKPGGGPEQPRGIAFHWLANIILASLALFAGVAFGEKIPREQMGTAFIAVAAVALALVPLTRYWEKSGIEARRKAGEQAKIEPVERTKSEEKSGDATPPDSKGREPPAD